MKRLLQIQSEPINEARLNAERDVSGKAGAVICFLGLVREHEGESAITALDYEAFVPMVQHQFEKIFDQVQQRWPIESVRLVHRIGRVPVNQPSLWVELTAPHRAEAFAACQYLIDEMKRVVPIWKRALC